MARWNTPEGDKIKARQMLSDGLSPYEIARQLGYTRTTIRTWTDSSYAEKRGSQIYRASQGTTSRKSRARERQTPSMPRVPM